MDSKLIDRIEIAYTQTIITSKKDSSWTVGKCTPPLDPPRNRQSDHRPKKETREGTGCYMAIFQRSMIGDGYCVACLLQL